MQDDVQFDNPSFFWPADIAALGAIMLYSAGYAVFAHERNVREEIESCLATKGYVIEARKVVTAPPATLRDTPQPVALNATPTIYLRDCRTVPFAVLRTCMGARP